jgi:hypothetical protein
MNNPRIFADFQNEEKIWVATIDWDKIREVAEVFNSSIDS